MSLPEKDIILTEEDIKKIKKVFSQMKFEDFKIHNHFYRDKFTGIIGKIPRHNMELSEAKRVYEKIDSIRYGFKRKSNNGHTYTICYHESKNVFVKLGFILDKDPKEIFMAIRIHRNLQTSVLRKYGLRI